METKKIDQAQINRVVWNACDTFRGLIDPSQYKDYILTMLFLKYVSDVYKAKFAEYTAKYDGDRERATRAMRHERFYVPEQSSFDHLFQHRSDDNIGELIDMPKEAWDRIDASMSVRKVTITRTSMTGKRLKELKIRSTYGVSITRVNRGGIDLVANPELIVQMGDTLVVVGHDSDINQVAKFVGNSRTGLYHPNLIPIFFGIALGVLCGSIPIMIPGRNPAMNSLAMDVPVMTPYMIIEIDGGIIIPSSAETAVIDPAKALS